MSKKKANKTFNFKIGNQIHIKKQFCFLPSKSSKKGIRGLFCNLPVLFAQQWTMPTQLGISNQQGNPPKRNSCKTLVVLNHEEGDDIWILPLTWKDSIYVLFQLDPRLKLFPTSLPEQKITLGCTTKLQKLHIGKETVLPHINSRWSYQLFLSLWNEPC